MFFVDRSVVKISEVAALRYLTRFIPYLTLKRRAGLEHEIWKLSEAISIYAEFIPYADRIKVEPLDALYTYTQALELIDQEFLAYLMLEAPGAQVHRQTTAAWLVLLSGSFNLFRVFEKSVQTTGINEFNKEIVSLVLDDGRGRTIDENTQIYEHVDLVRDAIARTALPSAKLKVILSTSRRGKRVIKAFKRDLPKLKSLYRREGAASVQQWAQSRSWMWYYSDPHDRNDRVDLNRSASHAPDSEWQWGYWL